MTTKSKAASVKKAAKTPTTKQLEARVASLTSRDVTLKHDAARARTASARKHDLARAAAVGKRIVSVKHQLASRKKSVKRGLALGDAVPCCVAEAPAMSLRLAGGPVTDDDVLALFCRAAGDLDEGASILATLEAAREYGLAGVRPEMLTALGTSTGFRQPRARVSQGRSLILGLDLPEGPHTVFADGGTWWSWGEPWPVSAFSSAAVEEAWAVTWP